MESRRGIRDALTLLHEVRSDATNMMIGFGVSTTTGVIIFLLVLCVPAAGVWLAIRALRRPKKELRWLGRIVLIPGLLMLAAAYACSVAGFIGAFSAVSAAEPEMIETVMVQSISIGLFGMVCVFVVGVALVGFGLFIRAPTPEPQLLSSDQSLTPADKDAAGPWRPPG